MRLESLLRAAREGQPHAWVQLARVLSDGLHAYYRRLMPRQDAEDLVQDVIVVALERLSGLDSDESLDGWILGVARNLWRESERQRDRDARLRDKLIISPDTRGPSTALHLAELLAFVDAEIEKLPNALREVVEHDLADGDPQLLADRRGVVRSTVRSLRSGANTILRKRLRHRTKTPNSGVSKLTAGSTSSLT